MSARRPRRGSDKGRPDWIEAATGRIGKIAALVGAIGGLVLLVLNQSGQIRDRLAALNLVSTGPCVAISDVVIPKSVEYRAWDRMRITVRGRNDCDEPPGLYLTFLPRVAGDARLRLRVPHEDLAECRSNAPVLQPKCWDPKKPVTLVKGDWQWETLPPPLDRLGDLLPTETISISWDVRSYDEPDQPPLATNTVQIEVTSQARPL